MQSRTRLALVLVAALFLAGAITALRAQREPPDLRGALNQYCVTCHNQRLKTAGLALDQLNVSQSMRFYWFEYKMPPPIPKDEIVSHSTNVHIIPATSEIASRCKSLRTGAIVHMSGDLVEASGPGISKWRSSLSRTDTGNGACELFYVDEISEIVPGGRTNQRALVQQ